MSDDAKTLRKIGKWLIIISMLAFFGLVLFHVNSKKDIGSQEANDLADEMMKELIIGYIYFPAGLLIGLWCLLCSESIIKFRDKLFAKGVDNE
jgi:hypothetical protein